MRIQRYLRCRLWGVTTSPLKATTHAELLRLIDDERPKVVDIVHWAASNGDRSENGDYIYGKKRLREIDRRIWFMTKRLQLMEVVNPAIHFGRDQVFFGATVDYIEDNGVERTVTILGIDEVDSTKAQVSWVSPIRRRSNRWVSVPSTTPAGTQF